MPPKDHILCIIPARGGSKRLPGKNIRPFLGAPLIAYAIRAAKGATHVGRTIVSTDDEVIAKVAREEGAEVPFMRPAELATDTAPTLSVLQHAVLFAEGEGMRVDAIVLIQPTVPGVRAEDADAAIEKLFKTGANSCVSLAEITERPEWMYRLGEKERIQPFMSSSVTRSQDLPKLYRLNGAVYATRTETLAKGNKIIDSDNGTYILMPRERSVDIDTEEDFRLAEWYLSNNISDTKKV